MRSTIYFKVWHANTGCSADIQGLFIGLCGHNLFKIMPSMKMQGRRQILMVAWIHEPTYLDHSAHCQTLHTEIYSYNSPRWQAPQTEIHSEMHPDSSTKMKIGTCDKVLEKPYADLKRFWEVVSNGRQMAYSLGCPAPGPALKNKQHLMWAMAEMGWADMSVLNNVRDSAVAEMLFIVRADADPSNTAALFVFCPFSFFNAFPAQEVPAVVRYVAFDSAYFDSWGNMLFTLPKNDMLRITSSSDRIYMDSGNLRKPEKEISARAVSGCSRGANSNPRSRSPSPVFGGRSSRFWG